MKASSVASLIAATAVLLSACSTSLHRVVPKGNADTKKEYFHYALPHAVMVVDIQGVVLEAKTPECTNADTLRRLRLSRPQYQGRVFVATKVQLSKRAEPDPTKVYAVELDDRSTRALALAMSPLGIPAKANSEGTSTGLALATSTFKLAASIAGLRASVSPPPGITEFCDEIEQQLLGVRSALLSMYSAGGAGDTKDVLLLKEAKLIAQAKALEAFFTGLSIGDPASIVCEVTDVALVDGRVTPISLLTWTMRRGVDEETTSCRVPQELRVDGTAMPEDFAKFKTKHTLTLNLDSVRAALSVPPASTPPTAERSFYYRLPALARVSVTDTTDSPEGRNTLTEPVEWAIPQLGTVASVPRLSSAGSIKLNVVFDPETGALIEFGTSRTSADPAALMTAITEQVNARRTAEEAEAAKDVELQTLQRQQAILEAMVAIEVAEATLAD